MIPARQSTALEIAIGPILDADGVAVTGGVVGDLKIKKTTGNFAALNGSATLTHVSAGVYDLVLTTSDTDTVGLCTIAIDDTTNACASIYLQVMEEAVYDMLYAASATGYIANQPVDVNTIKTQTVTCGAGVTVLASVGTAATSTAQTGDTYALANGSAGFVAIDTVVDAIKVKTDSLTFTVANVLDANTLRISGSATAADNAETVFDTDFATAYNTTTDGWNINATHWGGTAVASALVRGNLIQVGGSATPVTNIGTVFGAVHFADNYDSTNHRWSVNLMDMGSSGSINDVNALISMLGYYSSNAGFAVHGFTGTGATALQTEIWTNTATRTLTAGTNINGSTFTAIPWSAAWDSEVQSEVQDAIEANNLDHLVKIAVDTNFATTVHADSVVGQIADNGAGFDRTTDSLEAIRDAGFSTHSAADVWAVATRVLTAGTNIQLPSNGLDNVTAWTVNITGTLSGTVGGIAGTITTLDALDTAQDTQHGTTQAAVAAVQADLPGRITKNTALAAFMFKMVDATDHNTAETGLTVTATRSLDGAAFGACSNAVSEVSNGWYKIDLSASDLNGNVVVLRFTATGADTTEFVIVTQPT